MAFYRALLTYKVTATMGKGYALNVGLNNVGIDYYSQIKATRPLNHCIANAKRFSALAGQMGYEHITLLTDRDATSERLRSELTRFAIAMQPGDILLLSFSGHGGRGLNEKRLNAKIFDECWCLYDGLVYDHELYDLLSGFIAGTRILIIADSCYGGGITREYIHGNRPPNLPKIRVAKADEYPEIDASVLLMAAVPENELAVQGVFVNHLLNIWNQGHFRGTYEHLFQTIMAKMRMRKQPEPFFLAFGREVESMKKSRPFEIIPTTGFKRFYHP